MDVLILFVGFVGGFGWLAVFALGIRFLATRRKSHKKKVLGIILLIISFIWMGWVVYVWDQLPGARDKARLVACKSNLKQIGVAIWMYYGDHGEQMPTNLELLKDNGYLTEQFFGRVIKCPAGSMGDAYVPPLSELHYRYFYRLLEDPDSNLPMCWDAQPHFIRKGVFKFLQRRLRNILLADGRVLTIEEDKFQSLTLVGAKQSY